jgi:hypothetical protein
MLSFMFFLLYLLNNHHPDDCISLPVTFSPFEITDGKFICLETDTTRFLIDKSHNTSPFYPMTRSGIDSLSLISILPTPEFTISPLSAYQDWGRTVFVELIASGQIPTSLFFSSRDQSFLQEVMKSTNGRGAAYLDKKTVDIFQFVIIDTSDPALKCFLFGARPRISLAFGHLIYGLLVRMNTDTGSETANLLVIECLKVVGGII